jgi:hypothetical protein
MFSAATHQCVRSEPSISIDEIREQQRATVAAPPNEASSDGAAKMRPDLQKLPYRRQAKTVADNH